MACGRYLSLEEARRMERLDRFCKEHPSEGDKELFDHVLEAMAAGKPPKPRDRKQDAKARRVTDKMHKQ